MNNSNNNPGLTFLGMSGGILALVISLAIILPIIAVIVCCVGGAFIGAVTPPPSLEPVITPSG